MQQAILIFGAGENQCSLIEAAHRLNYRTIVIDPNSDAPGKAIADVFRVVAPKDIDTTIAIAKEFHVGGIVTGQMENPLPIMAKVAEEIGVIFPSPEIIARCRDKYLMKQAFLKQGVPCARGKLLARDEISTESLSSLRFPLIIKPADSFSSRGVFRIDTFADISHYIDETLAFSKDGKLIVEEYIEGDEFSVESITSRGTTTVMQITRKIITPFPHTVELGHIQPADASSSGEKLIKDTAIAAIQALGIDNSASHTELKLNSHGCFIIEIGARLGGDFIGSYLTDYSIGTSIEEAAIQVAMGKQPVTAHQFNKYSRIQYLELLPGKRVRSVGNWQSVMNIPGVRRANLSLKPGDTISPITDSAKRPGYVIVQGETAQEVAEMVTNAIAYITASIHYEDDHA